MWRCQTKATQYRYSHSAKKGGTVNDPDDWAAEHSQPRYIVDLVKSFVTVSLLILRADRNLPPVDHLPSSPATCRPCGLSGA